MLFLFCLFSIHDAVPSADDFCTHIPDINLCTAQVGCIREPGGCRALTEAEKIATLETHPLHENFPIVEGPPAQPARNVPPHILSLPNGFAFTGGGLRAEVKEWATMWSIFHFAGWGLAYDQIMDGKVVGTNSGGGWFFAGSLYNPDLYRTFYSNFGSAQHAFAYFTEKLTSRINAVKHRLPGWNNKNNEGMESVKIAYCGEGLRHCWRNFMEHLLTFDHQMHWNLPNLKWASSIQMLSEYKWASRNDHTGEQLAGLDCNFPDYMESDLNTRNKMVDRASATARGVIPMNIVYSKRNGGADNELVASQVHIPMMDRDEVIRMKCVVDASSLPGTAVERHGIVSLAEMKDLIKNSVTHPFEFPGPSSCAPGAVHASSTLSIAAAEAAIHSGSSFKWFWRTAEVARNWLENRRVGYAMVDGGTLDNVGLAACVSQMQRDGQHRGRIIAVLDGRDVNMAVYFNREPKTWPVMVPGIGGQKSTPYVWIFDKWMRTQKYALTKPNSDEYSGITIETYFVRTRDNFEFGVQKDSYYEIVFIINDLPTFNAEVKALFTKSSKPDIYEQGGRDIALTIGCALGNPAIPCDIGEKPPPEDRSGRRTAQIFDQDVSSTQNSPYRHSLLFSIVCVLTFTFLLYFKSKQKDDSQQTLLPEKV